MKKYIKDLLSPVKWMKARKYAKKAASYDKSKFDLELNLYSQILKTDMLHYGYFEDTTIEPDTISVRDVEDAQMKYAYKIVEQIKSKEAVLDIGCGMGGLSNIISEKGLSVESLTPNKNQIDHIKQKYSHLTTHHTKFEDFEPNKKFGTIINSESLQYIKLSDAFQKAENLIESGDRWIIFDYFRENDEGISKSGHFLKDFYSHIEKHNWRIVQEQDCTKNLVPTIKLANMYLERFLLPLKHMGYEKLRYKNPQLYYVTEDLRGSVDKKIVKEKASIDPEKFLREKKYMFFVLEKG